jgi:hypothetical protein
MYTQYGHKTISATIAQSASITTAIPILGFNKVAIEVPGYTNLVGSTTDLYFYVCQTDTGTFRKLSLFDPAAAIAVKVTGTAGNIFINIPDLTGFAYMKIEASVSATAAAGWPLVVHGIM